MGCDIHLHTEVKINGIWHHYTAPSMDRNYQLFGKMAGVRGSEPPVSEPKGLPSDMSTLTAFCYADWESDAHNMSWLNAEEINQVCQWANERFKSEGVWDWETDQIGYLFGNSWSGYTRYPGDRPEGLEDIRWIFWFDN